MCNPKKHGIAHPTKLNLSVTRVSDIGPLASLTNLQTLDLNGTQVADVGPLGSLKNLEGLWLDDTKVSDEQVADLQKALPKLKIIRS